MKTNYLLPNKFKKIGWIIFIPSAIIRLATLIFEYEPSFLDFNVAAIFIDEPFGKKQLFGMVKNNMPKEIFGILVIISSLLVAFSKEKIVGEYISKIRLESLVWAVYINYGIVLVALLFIFGFSFFWVMVANMFTVLLFFIIKFNWQISKLKTPANYEE